MARATVPGDYRVTRAITYEHHYYAVGDVVANHDGGLARIFGWELIPKAQQTKAASAPRKKGARKPAAKK